MRNTIWKIGCFASDFRLTIRSNQGYKECRPIDCKIKPLCGRFEKPFVSEKGKDYEEPKFELIQLDGDVVTASTVSGTIDWETEEFSLDDNVW